MSSDDMKAFMRENCSMAQEMQEYVIRLPQNTDAVYRKNKVNQPIASFYFFRISPSSGSSLAINLTMEY